MSSGENSGLDPAKATQILKEMLNLSKDSTASADVEHAVEKSAVNHSAVNGKAEVDDSSETGPRRAEIMKREMFTQQINFTESDEINSFPVYGNNVCIRCSPGNHTSGSSKVKIRNIVNSGWENRYYLGQQVACNVTGEYVAYTIKIPQNVDGVVRLVNWKTKQRDLLRGMKGVVVDIAFSYSTDNVMLASIDEFGSLFVHTIKELNGQKLIGELLLTVHRSDEAIASMYRRVTWCFYVPDEDTVEEEEDILSSDERLFNRLVVTHKNMAEIYYVDDVVKEHGSGPLNVEQITSGCQVIHAHTMPISDATFSPEGTAFATASFDGMVKFYQISLPESKEEICLHNWNPHGGKPLSCLFFLDNHNIKRSDVKFWRFAVTGADKNRELKIWSCSSWTCLQTLRFSVPDNSVLDPELKAGLDPSSEFLILSDVARSTLYVLNMYQDVATLRAQVSCISRFFLTAPMLSFAILSSRRRRFKPSADDDDDETCFGDNVGAESEDERKDEETTTDERVVLKLIYVQPKTLQECCITYRPSLSVSQPVDTFSTFSMDSSSFRDRLSDLSYETSVDVVGAAHGDIYSHLSSSNVAAQVLLPPDAFSSPGVERAADVAKQPDQSPSVKSNLMDLDTPRDSPCMDASPAKRASLMESPTSGGGGCAVACRRSGHLQDDVHAMHSAGSSPSLEVQEILNKDLDDADIQYIDQDPADEHHVANTPISASKITPDNLITLGPQSPVVLHSALLKARSLSPQPTFSTVKWPTAPQGPNYNHVSPERIVSRYDLMSRSVQGLVDVLQDQKQELQLVRQDIANLKSAVDASTHGAAAARAQQGDVFSSITALLQTHRQAETTSVIQILRNHEEKITSALMQTVNNTILTRLDTTVKSEFKSSIRPALLREVEKQEKMIHEEVVKRLSTTDSILKENIRRLVESKPIVSSIAQMVSTSLHAYLRSVFQEAFQNFLLPACDRSCQNMFVQLDGAFHTGTKEYMEKVESYLERHRQEGQALMTTQMHAVLDNISASTEHFAASVTDELDKQLQATFSRFEEGLTSRFVALVQKEMTAAIREHQSVISDTVVNAIRSRAVTPNPTVDRSAVQASIVEQLQHGELNGAFQQALSASDLQLVMFVCEKVNPARAFGDTPCQLQQPVLLSLIHQLSADLSTSTELKQEYLQEALVNLNLSDPQTSSHVPVVIDTLQQKLRHFIKANATSKALRCMRMLLMASESVLQRRGPAGRRISDAASSGHSPAAAAHESF